LQGGFARQISQPSTAVAAHALPPANATARARTGRPASRLIAGWSPAGRLKACMPAMMFRTCTLLMVW